MLKNDAQDESDDESEEEILSASAIKTSIKFLAMIDQQESILKMKSDMPTDIVEQLETQIVAMQFSLYSKQKQMQDYFKSTPRGTYTHKRSKGTYTH